MVAAAGLLAFIAPLPAQPSPPSRPARPAPSQPASPAASTPETPTTAPPTTSQPPDPDKVSKEKARLTTEFLKLFKAKKYDEAEPLCREIIKLDEYDFTAHYNLAACLSMQLKLEEAEVSLVAAVERGFVELDVMARDKNLAPLRSSKAFKALMAKWPEVQERVIEQKLDRTRLTLSDRGKGYTIQKDAAGHLAFLSAFPESSFKAALAEIKRMDRFWETCVLEEGQTAHSADPRRPDPWIMVLLPTSRDYKLWAAQKFGSIQIGGIYDHDQKQLVTQDIGPILRHEYMHALHWRHMMRTGFIQPTWVQEGLCSLVEDIQESPDGTMKAIPSWRTNMVRKMAENNALPKWDRLFALNPDQFLEQRGLANYAVARSIFLFLSDRGKLREWYAAYNKLNHDDPNGIKALEQVLAKPIAEIEKDWRRWARQLPEVPDANMNIKAVLPFNTENAGDGVRIIDMPVQDGVRAGLRVNDIITAIDDKPVREMNEYARVLSTYRVDDVVKVAYRRGRIIGEARVKLWQNNRG